MKITLNKSRAMRCGGFAGITFATAALAIGATAGALSIGVTAANLAGAFDPSKPVSATNKPQTDPAGGILSTRRLNQLTSGTSPTTGAMDSATQTQIATLATQTAAAADAATTAANAASAVAASQASSSNLTKISIGLTVAGGLYLLLKK